MKEGSFRDLFPIFNNEPNLAYLDTAATAQKPKAVIDRITRFYIKENANIHRGVYRLSAEATRLYDGSREEVRGFLNAKKSEEIIFVRGVTEGINLLANILAGNVIKAGDEILISEMEHHANIVPWQLVAKRQGAKIRVLPITDSGELDLSKLDELLSESVKVLSLTHVSNALGTLNPVREIIKKAKEKGIVTHLDGAQAVSHLKVDVQELDCDFYTFSGHKVYGPTGIGVLYGRFDVFKDLPPYQGGGDMIEEVSFEGSTFKGLPDRYEAGTPNICGAIALAEAIKFLGQFSWENLTSHERKLYSSAKEVLKKFQGLRHIGENNSSLGAISFVIDGVHPHDIGTILDSEGVCIRAGHHCAQPLMKRLGLAATARVSFGMYNTQADIDKLEIGLDKIYKIFRK